MKGKSFKTFGDQSQKDKYSSTVSMSFHGQNKQVRENIGQNPNMFLGDNKKEDIADTYIENLQQQIYFMELELKILKEKVIEDEKDSGIGGLFDDEKTSSEHI